MLHKAWNSKGEMPYCFPMSFIKFQGHTVQNITDFDPNWAFPDYRPVAAFKSLRFALLHIISFIGADGADNAVIQFHGKITARDIGVYCTLNLCFRRRQWHSRSGFIAWQPIRLSTMLARMYNHCVPFRYPNVPEVSAAEGLFNSMRPLPSPPPPPSPKVKLWSIFIRHQK